MRLSTTFVLEHWSFQLQLITTWTTWFRFACLVSPLASVFQANSTQTFANWLSTWFPFLVCISSCQDLCHWLLVDRKAIALWRFLSSLSKCLTPKTWWLLAIQDMDGIWPWQQFSEEEWAWRRLTSRCLTFKTKTLPTSSNGFQTTLRLQFAIFHHVSSLYLFKIYRFITSKL